MNSIETLQSALLHHIADTLKQPVDELASIDMSLNIDESRQQFGDLTTNAALILAKKLQLQPRQVAQSITQDFKHDAVAKLEIAGPGFINIFLTTQCIAQLARELYTQKERFFSLSPEKKRLKYNIEFVSANPTGPLHIGHGRGGIIGDVLGNILRFLGHEVTKEYYINDAGNQIQKLGLSFKIRCQQQLSQSVELPEDAYQGSYLIELAQECIAEHGASVMQNNDQFFCQYAKERMLKAINQTLTEYGIRYDVWFSEKSLHENGMIEHGLKILQDKGYLYTAEGALWFKSTQFFDDKDRVLKKNTGELTYVAADIAYIENKLDRGADKLIYVLGQDHHSYVSRLKGLMKALGHNEDNLEVILYQLVTLKESGELLRMSKRAGKIVSLKDVTETIGRDVARFFYLNKKADAHLDFDIDLALKQTEENPVFYAQYAFVRTASIMHKAAAQSELHGIELADTAFLGDEEKLLLKKIISLKSLLESIGNQYQTHSLTYYVLELAQTFHKYYSANRIIDLQNIEKSRGRLLVVQILHETFKLTFNLLGISAPESM